MSIIQITSTDNFETWLNKPFVSEELKATLSNASILILPTEGFRDHPGPVFPVQTTELYDFFKSKLPPDAFIDVCVSEDDFRELALHSDYKRIGNFLIKQAVLPVFIGILLLYVEHKYFKDEEQPAVKIENIVSNGTNTSLSNSPNSTVVNNNINVIKAEKPDAKEKTPVKKYHEQPKIKFSLTVVDTAGTAKEFQYEGTAKDLKTTVEEIKKLYNDGNQ
jgi:hypothetical protein